jgi:hypothetical protein
MIGSLRKCLVSFQKIEQFVYELIREQCLRVSRKFGVDIINQLTSSETTAASGTTSSAAHGSSRKRWRWLQRASHGSPDAAVLLQSVLASP